jgi:hypothetical protein
MILVAALAGVLPPLAPLALSALSLPLLRLLPAPLGVTAGVAKGVPPPGGDPKLVLLSCQPIPGLLSPPVTPVPLPQLLLACSSDRPSGGTDGVAAPCVAGSGAASEP